jgi:hypothetical protein
VSLTLSDIVRVSSLPLAHHGTLSSRKCREAFGVSVPRGTQNAANVIHLVANLEERGY